MVLGVVDDVYLTTSEIYNLPESVEKALKLLSQYPQANICLLSSVTQKHFVDMVILSSRGSPRKRLYFSFDDPAIDEQFNL